MDKLRLIETFVQTVKAGSFSNAADHLGVSPQSVSYNIGLLENTLGVRLFNRTTRSLKLTDEGHRFYANASAALAGIDEAMLSAKQSETPEGVVRISVSVGFGRRYVLPLIPEFQKRFPNITLDLQLDDRKVDMVKDGFDVVIRGGVIADSSLVTRRICDIEGVLVASTQYLNRLGVPKHPKDLLGHQLIQLRFLSGITPIWEFKNGDRIEPKGMLVLSDTEAVGEAALCGLGIAQASTHHIWPWLRKGQLKIVLPKEFVSMKREVVVQYPHRKHTALRVRSFVDFAVTAMKKNPDLHYKNSQMAQFHAR